MSLLAKSLDKTNNASFKGLLCIIKFVLDMHDYSLMIKSKIVNMSEPWSVTMFCDSNYAGDMDTCISMTGYCLISYGCTSQLEKLFAEEHDALFE